MSYIALDKQWHCPVRALTSENLKLESSRSHKQDKRDIYDRNQIGTFAGDQSSIERQSCK